MEEEKFGLIGSENSKRFDIKDEKTRGMKTLSSPLFKIFVAVLFFGYLHYRFTRIEGIIRQQSRGESAPQQQQLLAQVPPPAPVTILPVTVESTTSTATNIVLDSLSKARFSDSWLSDKKFLKNNVAYIKKTKTSKPFYVYVHDPVDCVYISKSILDTGVWEDHITPYFEEILGDVSKGATQKTFLDIGANIGWFSLLAASLGHKTYSIEPLEYNAELFHASIELNPGFDKLIKHYKVAVGKNPSDQQVCMNIGGTTNSGNGQLNILNRSGACTEYVPLTTIDQLLGNKDIQNLHLVKVDIEGYEWQALQGAAKTIEKHKPCAIEVEYVPQYSSAAGDDKNAYWEFFKDYNPKFMRGIPSKFRDYGDYCFTSKDSSKCHVSCDVCVKDKTECSGDAVYCALTCGCVWHEGTCKKEDPSNGITSLKLV